MGLFDKLLKKEPEVELVERADSDVVAVCTGKKIPTAEISDAVFAQEMMGKTIGIIPSESLVVSPANGTIEVLFPTGHAFGIRSNDGVGYLVHIGIDTVGMNGDGFKTLKKQGDTVKAGEPVVKVDFGKVKAQGLDPVTMLIITELPEGKEVNYTDFTDVKAGDLIV